MADEHPAPLEDRLRTRLRVISFVVFMGLIVVLVLADTFGAERRVSEFIFAGLLASALLSASLVTADFLSRFVGR